MEKQKEDLVRNQVIDAYFKFRSNLPQEGYVQQNRSTQEILDDLADMMYLTSNDIVEYLVQHEYAPTTELDGTVKWAIWRII